jgi:hypothetical protein
METEYRKTRSKNFKENKRAKLGEICKIVGRRFNRNPMRQF